MNFQFLSSRKLWHLWDSVSYTLGQGANFVYCEIISQSKQKRSLLTDPP